MSSLPALGRRSPQGRLWTYLPPLIGAFPGTPAAGRMDVRTVTPCRASAVGSWRFPAPAPGRRVPRSEKAEVIAGRPREIYRVYTEDEFWARAEQELHTCEQPSAVRGLAVQSAPHSAARRVVASTALVATVGALGVVGMLAMRTTPHRTGRRAGVRLLAVTGVRGAARSASSHIWRTPVARINERGLSEKVRRKPLTSQPRVASRDVGPSRSDRARAVQVVTLHHWAAPAGHLQVAVSVAPHIASQAAQVTSPVAGRQSEFGFER